MIQKAGFIAVLIGAMSGDSESLIVPLMFIAAGIICMYVGRRV